MYKHSSIQACNSNSMRRVILALLSTQKGDARHIEEEERKRTWLRCLSDSCAR